MRDLHTAGGRVLLYTPVMLHAKAVVFDDQLAVIGSANMDMRSLFLNYEVALYVSTPAHVAEVAGLGRSRSWPTQAASCPPPAGNASSSKTSCGSCPRFL